MEPPSIDNLFIACVPKFYFDDGTGERQLGLIEKPPGIELKSTEVKIYNSQDGKRRLKKLISTEEELTVDMILQEAVAANVHAYFKGGDIATINAGTDTIADQIIALPGEQLVSLGRYGISGVTVTNLAGDVTYVKNTDYVVDPGRVVGGLLPGRIGRIAAGAITDNQQVKVDYTYTTWDALRFPVAMENYITGAARLEFRPLDGFQWNFFIPRCQLKGNGKFSLDDKAPMELPMTLNVLDASDISPTAPYGYWECLNETA
ncbi:MAG: hypothetical protein PHZ19_02500 [Candidatus Thermoplasmatota archaeon]|nr:hypothetical protein [Candidatus Thermoplasmatota archaeon]